MKLDDIRAIAFSLPDASEAPHFEKSSLRVGGKIFATITEDERYLHAFVDEDEIRACVAEDATTFEPLHWGRRLVGVRVTINRADAERVRDLLEMAWRRKAPKRLVAEYDSGEAGP